MPSYQKDGYIEQIRKKNPKFRFIPIDKVYVNQNTPVGDEAEFFERKPHDGRRRFYPIGYILSGEYRCLQGWKPKLSIALAYFLESLNEVNR